MVFAADVAVVLCHTLTCYFPQQVIENILNPYLHASNLQSMYYNVKCVSLPYTTEQFQNSTNVLVQHLFQS